jgi:flagella basal body P-ring formation protein FlgA
MTVLHAAPRLSLLMALVVPLAGAAATPEKLVEQAARAQLDQRMAGAGLAEAQYELSVVSARAAPPCARPVEVEALDVRQPARMRFTARCPDAAGRAQEFVVRARISAPVLVTAAPVNSGEVLTDAHVTLERRDITNVADALGAPEAALGQTSRRSLRAGELLRASQLSAAVLVKRGDAVTMVARMEGIEVTTAGQALDAGAQGAMIRVRNAASGQIVRMRVIGAGVVEPVDIARISP